MYYTIVTENLVAVSEPLQVATHHTSQLGSTDPRTGLDMPMIHAQSSNVIHCTLRDHF